MSQPVAARCSAKQLCVPACTDGRQARLSTASSISSMQLCTFSRQARLLTSCPNSSMQLYASAAAHCMLCVSCLSRTVLCLQGGSGKSFDWSNLQVPAGLASKGWLLAGGLNPGNVSQAVATAHPTAVDVSSGVCGPDGLAKDHSKVAAFIAGAKQAAAAAQ